MKVQTQTPLSVLRGHTHAILLVPSDGVMSPSLRESIHNSYCEVELIGHPLFAMAAVVWREVNARTPGSGASTAFVAAEVDIQDLSPLFNAIRNRLPHVSTWVFHGELAVLIAAAQPRHDLSADGTTASSAAHAILEPKLDSGRDVASLRHEPPLLKIAEGTEFLEARADLDARELDEIERRFGGNSGSDDGLDGEEEPAPSAVRITREEIAMLMDDQPREDLPPSSPHRGPQRGPHRGPHGSPDGSDR